MKKKKTDPFLYMSGDYKINCQHWKKSHKLNLSYQAVLTAKNGINVSFSKENSF